MTPNFNPADYGVREASPGMTGLGAGEGVGTGIQAGTAIAAPVVAGTVGAMAGALTLGIGTAVAALYMWWANRKGPRQKIEATRIVNEAATHLEAVKQAYLSAPNRTSADKAAALQAIDYTFAQLVAMLQDPQLGEPGRRAIQERIRGTGGTVRWDWYSYYRDPVEQDNPPAATVLGNVGSTINRTLGLSPDFPLLPLLLLGGLLFWAWRNME